ncbi:MAG: FKBP-type peptidyl-prolyl cis-trans isomerase [Candidatus Paceibacterota bacterium]
MDKKKSLIISVIIFVIVIGVLIFITINSKKGPATVSDQNNVQNTQQVDGVKVTIFQEGNGDIAKTGDLVSVNYTGKLADGTAFDSNVDPKFNHVQPFVFAIGSGETIKGWDIGVAGMKVGEKRILEIAPEYAYGAIGAGEAIPPNATITFEVELLEIKK